MLLNDLTESHLPVIPPEVTWDDLNLPTKTYKIITSALNCPDDLNHMSVRELLDIPQMTRKGIFDLLFAIQAHGNWKPARTRALFREGNTHGEHSVVSPEEITQSCTNTRLEDVEAKYFPFPSDAISFSDAHFSAAARRVLRRAQSAGLIRRPADLGQLRIGEVLQLSGVRLIDVKELVAGLEPLANERKILGSVVMAAKSILAAPYAESVLCDDVRFGSDVVAVASNAANAKAAAISVLSRSEHSLPAPIVAFKRRLDEAFSFNLEQELASIATGIARSEFDRDILLKLLGWGGTTPQSVREMARELGCSYQALYERRGRALRILRGGKPFAPALDRVLRAIESCVPAPADAVEQHLVLLGLTQNRFHLKGIQIASAILGRTSLSFEWKWHGNECFIVTPRAPGHRSGTPHVLKRAVAVRDSIGSS